MPVGDLGHTNANTNYGDLSSFTKLTGSEQSEFIQSNLNVILTVFGLDQLSVAPTSSDSKTSYDGYSQFPQLVTPNSNLQETTGDTDLTIRARQQLILNLNASNLQVAFNDLGITLSEESINNLMQALLSQQDYTSTIQKLSLNITIQDLINAIQKATQSTIEQANLPQTWNLLSSNLDDWTPITANFQTENELDAFQNEVNAFYDKELVTSAEKYLQQAVTAGLLSEEDAAVLLAAIQAGEDIPPGFETHYTNIVNIATQLTQAKYGLSSSWLRGTEDEVAWTPIGTNPITTEALQAMRLSLIVDSVETMITDFSDVINLQIEELLAEGVSPEDQQITNLTTLIEFLKSISEAIRELKEMLREIQLADAERSEKDSQAKMAAIEERFARVEEKLEASQEARQKAHKMEDISQAMQIIGPCVTALTTIIGILITVASLGTLTAVGVAIIAIGITLGLAIMAYSIADSVTGCSQDLAKAIKDWLSEVTDGDEVKQAIIIAAMAVVLIALLIVLVAVGGGGAAASAGVNAATQSSIQVGQQLVKQAFQALLIQILMTLLMGTDVIPELYAEALKNAGMSDEEAMYMRILLMVVMFALIMGSIAVGGKLSGSITGLFSSAGTKIGETAAGQAVKEAVKTAQEAISSALERLKELLEKATDQISETTKAYIKMVIAKMQQFAQKVIGFLQTEAARGVVNNLPYAASITGDIAQGIILLETRKLYETLGDTESAEALLAELIKLLEKIVKKLLDSISENSEFVTTLANFSMALYQAADEATGKLTGAILPQGSA